MAVHANTRCEIPESRLPTSLLKRRVKQAAVSAAALAMGGCAMFGGDAVGPKPQYVLEPDTRPVTLTPQQKQIAKQVEEFAAEVEAATTKPASTGGAVTPVAATPASAATPPVLLASANNTSEASKVGETPKALGTAVASATPREERPAGKIHGIPSATITPMPVSTEKVTPAAMSTAVAVAAPVSVGTATPVAVVEQAAEPTLEEALAIVRKNIYAKPGLNAALALSLLDAAQGKSPDATLTTGLPEADQKVLADLLGALTAMNSTTGQAGVGERVAPLVVAAKKWEGECDLQLPKLLLASRVDSYGVYSAIDAKFEAGKRHTVIIYCEVANFSSKTDAEGWHQTRLSQQETLITEDGLLVWRPNAEEVEDRSMNQRRDFYLVKKLTIPENLAAGKYTLRMSVTDKHSGKIAMVNLPLEITGR